MSTVTVASVQALYNALKVAHSGDTILLAPGAYSGIALNNIKFSGNVTIGTADPAHAAVLNGLNINNSSGLTFSGLHLSTTAVTTYYAFSAASSSNINFTNITAQGTSTVATLGGAISGFYIHDSSNVSITNSKISLFANAVTELNNNKVNISGNTFSDIRSDGIDNGGSSNVTISNNQFTNFHPESSTQHPDAIQFWTTNTSSSAHDITISGNTISAGTGGQIQGIFMNDEVGNLHYQNVKISGNTIQGEQYNAIAVTNANNLTVSNNSIVASAGGASWLRLQNASGVTLNGNDATSYLFTNVTGLNQSQNKIAGVLQGDTITSSVSASIGPFAHILQLTGTANISGTADRAGTEVIANNGNDSLYGLATNVTLIGGKGNDFFHVTTGNDTLTGGGENDTFMFSVGIGTDTVTDFGRAGSHETVDIREFLNAGMKPILTDSGNETIITFAHSQAEIILMGVHSNQLTATSYGFYH